MKIRSCIVLLTLLATSHFMYAQNIGKPIGIGTSTPIGTLQVKGDTTYDGRTSVYITNNTPDFGRAQLVLTGRLQAGNDLWRFGTQARNAIIFALNEAASGVSVGDMGAEQYTLQLEGNSKSLGFLSALKGHVPNMVLTQDGRVGIGTNTPTSKFEVSTTSSGEQSSLGIEQSNITGNPVNKPTTRLVYNWYGAIKSSINFHRGSTVGNGFMSFSTSQSNNALERMRIDEYGNVAIGTEDARGFKLAVAGKMIAEKIVVKTYSNWPDYVFDGDYKLPSLTELENYITAHKHLPDIPSAKEVQQNGIDLGEMNAKLLQKVEELSLYIIEQQKTIQSQNKRIEKLEQIIQ